MTSEELLERAFRCACAARTGEHFCESCWERWVSTMSAMLPGEVAEALFMAGRPRWEALRARHKAHGRDQFQAFRRTG
jgi:hypothetical protein